MLQTNKEYKECKEYEEYKEAAKMGRQRKRPHMKEQENSPEELDGMEGSNLSDREFKVMNTRMLNSMKKDKEAIKKDQSEIKNTMSE